MSQAPTTNPRYSQEASQAEKERLLREQRTAGTRVAYGNVIDPPAGGRFAKPSQSPDPATLYPAQPPHSPWHHDPVPDEEPLGFSVEDMLPVGEPHEISAASSSPAAAGLSTEPANLAGSSDVVASPPFSFRRRFV
jgi:hypothetical protein